MSENRIIDFYKKRWIFFGISLGIMLLGIIMAFMEGIQLDIQFKGGALLKYSYAKTIDADAVADVASNLLKRPVSTQLTKDLASGEQRLVISISGNYGVEAKQQSDFDNALKEKFPDNKLDLAESSMVEPFFGKKFLTKGITAIILSFLLVMVYVWIRFRKIGGLSAGVAAIIALIHDVLAVFITCIAFKIPIGDSFIAVTLSIIGYSVNDTIVIYDRIRENSRLHPKTPVDTLTNLSITQCFSRSVNTSLAVFISVLIVYILAAMNSLDSIQSFALPMAIGTISGCYSTICIAGPIWVMWKQRKGSNTKKA